ncbi:hypothetical protein QBC42DRAFT_255175 [Cladorrhinum samala]|uniref:Uncharacterized protein n=1 Tax=Cladorrhinum samala TaxID=585594 RepID=A0AAV9HCW0_9PEZI|nr:hypothetical protein QBC42DRAFT_255175 [Cladorrhinum samala]
MPPCPCQNNPSRCGNIAACAGQTNSGYCSNCTYVAKCGQPGGRSSSSTTFGSSGSSSGETSSWRRGGAVPSYASPTTKFTPASITQHSGAGRCYCFKDCYRRCRSIAKCKQTDDYSLGRCSECLAAGCPYAAPGGEDKTAVASSLSKLTASEPSGAGNPARECFCSRTSSGRCKARATCRGGGGATIYSDRCYPCFMESCPTEATTAGVPLEAVSDKGSCACVRRFYRGCNNRDGCTAKVEVRGRCIPCYAKSCPGEAEHNTLGYRPRQWDEPDPETHVTGDCWCKVLSYSECKVRSECEGAKYLGIEKQCIPCEKAGCYVSKGVPYMSGALPSI